MTDKFVIACDIDEVLFPYLAGYVKYWNRVHGSSISVADFTSYDFGRVHTGHTRAYISDMVYAFHDEPEFVAIEPLAGSLEAIRALQQIGDLHFVTARQAAISQQTHDWIKRHFNIDSDRIHMGNHYTRPGDVCTEKRTKAEMCKAINASVLIDDSLGYATECANAGMHVLLFDLEGTYGWNKSCPTGNPLHPNITRVHSWQEAIEHLKKLAANWH
jgi:uncharacterized HAD superfamily protein